MNSFFLSIFSFLFYVILTVMAMTLFSGCYTLKQGTTMLGYLGKAVALEKLAVSTQTDGEKETLAFVERVADIRRFATEELGLKESKNYTRYVEIDRDYLAAVVSACAADSFTRHEWHFPVVGTVPYKGFFDPKDAKKEAAKLNAEGLDVWVRKVDAFSTLGWFKDPLYSYMKNYTDYQLADLIIHELLHATVFVRGRVQFNEQLAEFAGSLGARLYIENRFGVNSEEYRAIDSGSADRQAFRTYLGELRAELDAVYKGDIPGRAAKLAEKERVIRSSQERFEKEYKTRFQSENYRGFSTLPINNAYLDLYRLYYEEDNFFADLFEKLPDSGIQKLRSFIAAAASLNNSKDARKDPRKAVTAVMFP
jgi:predicted aminopeptidase